MNRFLVLFIISIISGLTSCDNNEVKRYISNPGARFSIDLTNADNALMNGGAIACYVDKSVVNSYREQARDSKNLTIYSTPRAGEQYEIYGFSGVLIFNTGSASSGGKQSLMAYDLCCPVEDRKDVRILPANDYKANCAECKSEYSLFDGIPTAGKAKSIGKRLQIYGVNTTGGNKYQVIY